MCAAPCLLEQTKREGRRAKAREENWIQPMEVRNKGMIMSHCFSTVVLLLLIALPFSTSTNEASKVRSMIADIEDVLGRSFDYIIVGGGASGCSLAATLSEEYSVLLVERGGSPYGNPVIEEERSYGLALIQTDHFTSASQQFVSEDGIVNHRGRVLGGSTAINGGFYSRASAEFIKRVGWDEELVRESFEWVESQVAFQPSRLSAWQSTFAEGLIEAGIRPFNGFTFEHIQGTKVGGTIFDGDGRRHTAADILANAANPNNIALLLNATVQKVTFHDAGDGKQPRAHGIRFMRSNANPADESFEVFVKHPRGSGGRWGEVILCAGALGSPQILMFSGIGPKEHLIHFNITPLIDAKDVGQSMQDNPIITYPLNFSSDALHMLLPDTAHVAGIANRFRFIFEGRISDTNNTGRTRLNVSPAVKMACPVSRGSLRLVSVDPRENPSVKFNYLSRKEDMDQCAEMARILDKIARSTSISGFLGIGQSILPNGGEVSSEELRDFCKERLGTIYHYHGGCLVGSVVDRDYRVLGVQGLRVVDFSTFLDSPGTNPMATVLMLGRYQGVKILREKKMVNEYDTGTGFSSH